MDRQKKNEYYDSKMEELDKEADYFALFVLAGVTFVALLFCWCLPFTIEWQHLHPKDKNYGTLTFFAFGPPLFATLTGVLIRLGFLAHKWKTLDTFLKCLTVIVLLIMTIFLAHAAPDLLPQIFHP